jgi:glycosyltransferase involved in cell wall biosynthesis
VATSESLKVSFVIPAFNEAARIQTSLQRISEYLKGVPYATEIIVVDDGSTDKTVDIVKSLEIPGLRLLPSLENHGKGYSVRKGVLSATGHFVLFTDADLSAPIEELEKLLVVAVKENADVVIGSRGLDMNFIEKHQSSMRESGGRLFNVMVRLVLGLNIYDTQCGFKLFRRATVISAFEKLTTDRFGFDPELLFIMTKQGLKIREVSVRWSHVEGSKVQFLSDGVRMFTDLLRIRWNSFKGKYR